MDEEEIRIDIAEAIGKATATLSVNIAVVTLLIERGLLSKNDAATVPALATGALKRMDGLPPDARLLAESALRGLSKSWSALVTKH